MEHQKAILSLVVLLPLVGAVLIGLLGFLNENFRKNEKLIGAFATLMVFIPFTIVAALFFSYSGHPIEFGLFGDKTLGWMASDFSGGEATGLDIGFNYVFDQLSITMALIITGVGALIHVYSSGYMHGDRGYYKYFLFLNLFIFAMLNLVLGQNMVVMFLGWEGVGACSYFLIGYWYEDMEKAKAAQKAFIANRIGDFAMLAAMFIAYGATGTLNFHSTDGSPGLIEQLAIQGGDVCWWVALLVFIAATGKSAQIPLYVWLPDAMAGPTPVSALIHAATMVTSGIYLIARMSPVYVHAESIMVLVSVVGACTAILAALIAVAQNDIKKVLAYSTVSQLGFMFMALGAGAFTTAIFHVMTHAFFKACLFLGSGSVIHAMDHMHTVKDPQDIRTMGGLKKYMPATHITFFISTLAIAGIPGLAGFFSKDEILGKVFAMGSAHTLYYFVYIIGIITAFLTAFYMTRVYFLTFRGKERFPHDHHPHESPSSMTIPLYILAALAIVGGLVGLPEIFGHNVHLFNNWLTNHGHGPVVGFEHHAAVITEVILIGLSIVIAVAGVMFSWNLFSRHSVNGDTIIQKRLGKFYTWMQDKFYVDELYEYAIIKPFVYIGKNVIMGFDKYIIDGFFLHGIGNLTIFIGDIFKRIQTGVVTHYAFMVAAGMLAIMTYLIMG